MRGPVHITDHALLRYLERHLGIDIDQHRRDMAQAVRRGVESGACGVISGGLTFKLQQNCVTTCYPSSEPDIRTGCAHGKRGSVDD